MSLVKESDILDRIENVLNNGNLSEDEFFEEYNLLAQSYKAYIKRNATIIKISDSTQQKLFIAREKLKEQNHKIQQQNDLLVELNKTKDKYLSIINAELKLAARYVISLLPAELHGPDIKTKWSFVPSAELGGDIFGYHWIDKSNFAFYLLDVSGHGVSSALHSVSAFQFIRHQTLPNRNFRKPVEVISGLNQTFRMQDNNDMFFTLWYGVYNKSTMELEFSCAGHHSALLFNTYNTVTELLEKNLFVGGADNFPYTSQKVKIKSGSSVYIFSDGAFEIKKPDGDYMEIAEMINFLKINKRENDSEIGKYYKYLLTINSDHNGLTDDFSMMKITFF